MQQDTESLQDIRRDIRVIIKEELQETHRMVVLTNNSLQSFKQDVAIKFEEIDKKFIKVDEQFKEMGQKMDKGFQSLHDLIISGDRGAAKLILEREQETEKLEKRVTKLETKVFAV